MDTRKLVMSLGTAIAASKIARSVTGIELEDVLGSVGLSRRRSHFLENLGLVAAGWFAGADVSASVVAATWLTHASIVHDTFGDRPEGARAGPSEGWRSPGARRLRLGAWLRDVL